MQYSQNVLVHTDHKNLTYNSSDYSSDRVLNQRLLLEEYGVKIRYIKGETNMMADVQSQLPKNNNKDMNHFWTQDMTHSEKCF